MSDLSSFARQIEGILQDASRKRLWTPEESDKYMTEVRDRSQRFEVISRHVNADVIRPRLNTVASHFTNASMAKDEGSNRCACWFGYCERFPATTRIEFSVGHDARFEKLFVHFEFHMMPVFQRFNEQDNLPIAIDQTDDDRVADWVEERLAEFLNDYLCIDRGQEDFEEDVFTDPVCGMRMGRSAAVGTEVYCGHPYFFCSADCLSKFHQDPQCFTQIKVL